MGQALTLPSAVAMMTEWIHQHGRPPERLECQNSYGLPNVTTLGKFGGLSTIIALACGITPIGMQPCLQCGNFIRAEGVHIRHCSTCRRELSAATGDTYSIPGLTFHFDDEDLYEEIG